MTLVMARQLVIAAACVCIASTFAMSHAAARSQQTPSLEASDISTRRAVVDRYCVSCHNARAKTAGVVLEGMDGAAVERDPVVWEKVIRKLRSGSMPPQGMPRPDPASYDAVAGWLETTLDRVARAHPDAGRPLVHRLNRTEYANAIHDLLALDVDAATLLPPDDASYGFDNVADVLGTSPALLESYLAAAAKISALAVGSPSIGPSAQTFHVRGDASQVEHVEGLPLGTRGGLIARAVFPLDGEYVFKVKLLQTNLGSIRGLEYPEQLEITIDGERVHLAPLGGAAEYIASPENATDVANEIEGRLQARVPVKAGSHEVGVTFLQTTSAQRGNHLQSFLRTTLIATDHTGLPHVESASITGPFNATGPGNTPSRRRIFVCRPDAGSSPSRPSPSDSTASEGACAQRIISTLARRAFRRPVSPEELGRLVAFYRSGRGEGTFEHGIELTLRAILASPKFVFRVETDPPQAAPGSTYRLGDLELASRLSFFLWSSIPDDELVAVAASGRLKDPVVFEQQVRRMLADERAETLVTNFAAQWLYLRNLRGFEPDKNSFPDFDDNLRQAFERETELFFTSIIREDRSVLDLMTADYTFVNERLARHYGIPHVYGSHFRRVPVTDDARRGLLGQGSILMVTSHADRTSPVVRGKWILDNLLGTPPLPPPPDVPPLKPTQDDGQPHSLRERMEEHRANPACASCHKVMDPLGFALENFDAVGAWRNADEGAPIDASGQLADGTRIDGVVSLRQALLKRPDTFVSTMTEKMLTYALGRGLSAHDMPAVRAIVRDAAARDDRFSALVFGIVNSVPFQMRTKSVMADN
jgi:mono/diheme cytochrome c family protein